MELYKIISARGVLESFAEKSDIGAHLAYWMTKFVVKTNDEYEFYLSEMRKLYAKYATDNVDGSAFVPNEYVTEFNEAVDTLNKTDAEDPGIRFSLSELSAELKLSMKQMYPLLDFIDEEK